MATAPDHIDVKVNLEMETQHVHIAMLKILGSLSVEKTAMLPGNMGGKPYIEAHYMAGEIKKAFVAEGLIVLPEETIVRHEVVARDGRAPNVAVAIEATYTIISTVDGSRESLTGTGDGLASGTAVASNIASTNAFKNAFLRTFMITEQSVEQQALAGVADDDEKAEPRAVATARGGATQKKEVASAVTDLQDEVKNEWHALHGDDDEGYVALGNKMYGEPANWATNQTKLKSLIKSIKAGEVA